MALTSLIKHPKTRGEVRLVKALENTKGRIEKVKAKSGMVVRALADVAEGSVSALGFGFLDGRFRGDDGKPYTIGGMALPLVGAIALHLPGFIGDFYGWKFSRDLHAFGNGALFHYVGAVGTGMGIASQK